MFENIYYQIKKIFKDFLFSVGNLFLMMLSYLLQIIATIIILLIAILVINVALMLKVITAIRRRNEQYINGENRDVYSKIF